MGHIWDKRLNLINHLSKHVGKKEKTEHGVSQESVIIFNMLSIITPTKQTFRQNGNPYLQQLTWSGLLAVYQIK